MTCDMKTKEYFEGREAKANFEDAMIAAFQAPKTPRPQPKRKLKATGGETPDRV